MATARRVFGTVDGAKRDDDLPPNGQSTLASAIRSLRNLRRRRIIFGLIAAWLLYLFVSNIPTDLAPVSKRYDQYGAQRPSLPKVPPSNGPQTSSTGDDSGSTEATYDYDGPIKFYALAYGLREYEYFHPGEENVLFVLSSLTSTSSVVSAACTMAAYNRTKIHVAVMGRQEVDLQNLLTLNGIDEQDCPIVWHNAQPDYAAVSTPERMSTSVEAALGHLHKSLALQTIFYDASSQEDEFLRLSIPTTARRILVPAMHVPDRDVWMLSLDGKALRDWETVTIDIIVQVESESSALAIQLLKSIQRANYGGLHFPRLTVELHGSPDRDLMEFIAAYQWPPQSTPSQRRLNVRRQTGIGSRFSSLNSLYSLESFYPNTAKSHVLILSANNEVNANFFQVVTYLVLEYKHSRSCENLADRLMGVRLEVAGDSTQQHRGSMLLSQEPGAGPTLYFGDQWPALHQFVARRHLRDPEWTLSVEEDRALSSGSSVWSRAISEMMQLQSKFMIRPLFTPGSSPLVISHHELSRSIRDQPESSTSQLAPPDSQEFSLEEKDGVLYVPRPNQPANLERPLLPTASVAAIIKPAYNESNAVNLDELDIYNSSGHRVTLDESAGQARKYREAFSKVVGGCSAKLSIDDESDTMEGLFCS